MLSNEIQLRSPNHLCQRTKQHLSMELSFQFFFFKFRCNTTRDGHKTELGRALTGPQQYILGLGVP